jgi:hypothetical protein
MLQFVQFHFEGICKYPQNEIQQTSCREVGILLHEATANPTQRNVKCCKSWEIWESGNGNRGIGKSENPTKGNMKCCKNQGIGEAENGNRETGESGNMNHLISQLKRETCRGRKRCWKEEHEMLQKPGNSGNRESPSRAEPSRSEPSRAEPSRAEPSRAGPSRAEPSRAEPSRAEPSLEISGESFGFLCISMHFPRPQRAAPPAGRRPERKSRSVRGNGAIFAPNKSSTKTV